MKGPDAMDVDGLTRQQRFIHRKKGLCFECHLPGHNADVHKKTQDNNFKKPNGKGTYDKIRALITELDDEDKEEALKLMEEQGF